MGVRGDQGQGPQHSRRDAAGSAVPVCLARCNRPCESSGNCFHSLFWAPAQAQMLQCCVPALVELRTDPGFLFQSLMFGVKLDSGFVFPCYSEPKTFPCGRAC